jgi:hypothetical protein
MIMNVRSHAAPLRGIYWLSICMRAVFVKWIISKNEYFTADDFILGLFLAAISPIACRFDGAFAQSCDFTHMKTHGP